MKNTVALGVMLAFAACSGTQKSIEAEASYLGQQLDCVDAFDTKPAIDACRAKVRAQWGVVDAGKDGD